jgi:hypothetical protein
MGGIAAETIPHGYRETFGREKVQSVAPISPNLPLLKGGETNHFPLWKRGMKGDFKI